MAQCGPQKPAAGVEEMKVRALPSICLHSKVLRGRQMLSPPT